DVRLRSAQARSRMRPFPSSLLVMTAVFSFAAFAPHAFAQSPFPVPDTRSLPQEPGRVELVRSCNVCHPIMAVLGRQPTELESRYAVDTMRVRGAKLDAAEAARVAEYLAKHFAPGMPRRPGAGVMRGGPFTLGGRPPDDAPVLGKPLET